jgi:methionyl-tRNA synthetase
MSAGLPLPRKVFSHGWWTVNSEKMGKSAGNAIKIPQLISIAGVDSARYFLLREAPFGEDGDFSPEALIERHNNELANKLGNLVSRISTLAEKYGLEKSKPLNTNNLTKKVQSHLENLEFDKALNEIFQFIDLCNVYIQNKKPWETQDKEVLYQLSDAIKDIAILLSPFMPETSEKIAKTFNFEISLSALDKPLKISKITKSDILFKKIDLDKEKNHNSLVKEISKDVHKIIDAVKDKIIKPIDNKMDKPKQDNPVKPTNKTPNNKQIDNAHRRTSDNDNNLNTKKTSNIEGVIKMEQINFNDFAKVDLRVGTIKKIEDIEGADKLYKLEVQIGKEARTICAGIKQHYKKEELKDKQIIVITNLEPRKMKGIESQGMLLAAVSEDHSKVVLISPEKKVDSGLKVS